MTSDEAPAPASAPVPEAHGAPAHKRARRRLPRSRFRISIQSKILIALLLSSILSVAVIAYICAVTGRNTLREVESERLIELRQTQTRQIESLFRRLTNSLIVYSADTTLDEAVVAFSVGFDRLADASITPVQQNSIVDYYRNQMIDPIERLTGEKIDLNAVLPKGNAQRYLQAHYTAPRAADADPVADAGDGSVWSSADARVGRYLHQIVKYFDYQDVLLLDTDGNVVYSVDKGPDLGTNILTGPYRESNLHDAYQKALRSNDLSFVWITDFQSYQPQLAAPTAWAVSPIGVDGKITGVMALPVPISKINNIMTARKHWESAGMGKATETYLVGPDHLMRSDSRLFLEDPQRYRTEVIAAGTAPSVADRAIRLGGTILVQPVENAGVRAAQRGELGVSSSTDYTGSRELEAYGPLDIPNSDLHWSVLATRDDSAAFERIGKFSKTLTIAVAVIVFLICLASMLISQAAMRPLRRLEKGVHRVGSGDYDVDIPVRSRDEIGDLTHAFNEMSRSLAINRELLDEQRKENDRMLLALMPESVVQRYRGGESTIAQKHQDVAVVFADIVGLDEVSADMSGDELVGVIDELFSQFDSAATACGVERIRTFHNGYLASCGVVTPRLDSIHRSVEFALDISRVIERLNSRGRHRLGLRVGITTGNVVSGLAGQSGLAFDMWGSAVSLAYQMHSSATQPGIFVSPGVYEAMRDSRQFTAAGTVSVDGAEQTIYRLSERR
ncbi:adenylate/guanylate cyclase domain-containing protein [Mycobacterium sp.]|uniref:adenylate/guanylate cyclase domain-containing protein n=1 Tax=Mycobacterium sp. TaxID=1785 RepID=UPI003A83E6CB